MKFHDIKVILDVYSTDFKKGNESTNYSWTTESQHKRRKKPNVIASFLMIQSEEVISALAIEGNTFVLSFWQVHKQPLPVTHVHNGFHLWTANVSPLATKRHSLCSYIWQVYQEAFCQGPMKRNISIVGHTMVELTI